MSKSDIPEKVRYLLWAKTAGRCEFDNCNEPLWRDCITQIEMNFADVAHIIGDQSDGPRGHPVLSQEYCNNISNLMLMCSKHHKLIDRNPELFPDDKLRKMKLDHENRIEILGSILPDKASTVVFYKGRIGEIEPKINFQDAWNAMVPEYYPDKPLPIELGMKNTSIKNCEEDFWSLESKNLERQFAQKILPLLDHENTHRHLSVFGFAPQPLLIKFGSLITDLVPTEVYQLHREPNTWKWQSDISLSDFHITAPKAANSIVVLNISFSANIHDERIHRIFPNQSISQWKMSISDPNNDFLRNRASLQLFRQEFRKILNRIKLFHGENSVIHIFPAVPISIAIEIGRIRQEKADLPFVIYDQNCKSGGFIKALVIGDI